MATRRAPKARQTTRVERDAGPLAPRHLTSHTPWVPFALTAGLFTLSFLPRVQGNVILTQSFWGATAGLLLWQGALFLRWSGPPPSLDLIRPRATDVIIDIASEWSIFPQTTQRLTGATVYRQDLIYPAGVHGQRIGGSAAHMPVPDGFADTLVAHNSYEHFEGNSDSEFIREAWRVLKPGGVACILPLFMTDRFVIISDPLVELRESGDHGRGRVRIRRAARLPAGGALRLLRPWRSTSPSLPRPACSARSPRALRPRCSWGR